MAAEKALEVFGPFPGNNRDTIELPKSEQQLTEKMPGVANFGSGRVNFTYERPLEYIEDETPLVIINGYVGVKSAYKLLRRNVVQLGRPAITIRPVRKHSRRASIHPKYLLNASSLHSRAAYSVISDITARCGVENFDLVGHSMGGWVAGSMAQLHPDKIRSVTFMASAGLESHTLGSLLLRLPTFTRKEFLPHIDTLRDVDETRLALEAMYYVLRNPGLTIREGVGVSRCDIRPLLPRLGELGVRTAILNFASDELIHNRTTEKEVGHLVDYCETHPSKHLGHLAPQLEPLTVARSLHNINRKLNH